MYHFTYFKSVLIGLIKINLGKSPCNRGQNRVEDHHFN